MRLIDARRHTAGVDLEWLLSSGQFWLSGTGKRTARPIEIKLPAALAERDKQRLATA